MTPDQLGVQAHCLRFEIAAGLEQALERLASLRIRAIELMSFPGCRGNPWGDFGAAAERDPREIAGAVRAAGLRSPSVMVLEHELQPPRFDATLRWVRELGCARIVQSAFAIADDAGIAEWHAAFEQLERLARRIRAAGLGYALHTQPGLWRPIGGQRPIDTLLQRLNPELFLLEYDPSGAIIYGTDPAAPLRARPDAFFALHLRDGCTPPEPVFYLPALPLGAGGVDWAAVLQAAAASSIEWYFLEMEVSEPQYTHAALADSHRYLLDRGFLQSQMRPAR